MFYEFKYKDFHFELFSDPEERHHYKVVVYCPHDNIFTFYFEDHLVEFYVQEDLFTSLKSLVTHLCVERLLTSATSLTYYL